MNRKPRDSRRLEVDVAERVLAVARLLAAMGEALRAVDRIITGSIVQVPIEPGDEIRADLGQLGRGALTIGGGRDE